MAKKVYAVKSGRKTGIFYTWEDCRAQVMGYGSAVYKSFTNIDDATAYLNAQNETQPPVNEKADSVANTSPDNGAVAYVDGSYRNDTKEFSCGAVLFYKGEEIYLSQKFDDPEMAEMRNVAGEIMGSVSVIKYCVENGIPSLEIYYDYEGVARWATGDWKTNKDGTRAYKEFCIDARKKLKYSFVKVKGHSGDKYNDMADSLAKKALGII